MRNNNKNNDDDDDDEITTDVPLASPRAPATLTEIEFLLLR